VAVPGSQTLANQAGDAYKQQLHNIISDNVM
jgi:hypothetical protein